MVTFDGQQVVSAEDGLIEMVQEHRLDDLVRSAVGVVDGVRAEIVRLEELGTANAGEYWKPNREGEPRYLYLQYSRNAVGGRRKEYIGHDEAKVVEARERVQRYALVQAIKERLRRMENKLRQAKGELEFGLRMLVEVVDSEQYTSSQS